MRQTIQLKHGRELTACYSFASPRTDMWLVFIPESGSDFLHGDRGELGRLLNPRLAAQFNYLAINKPGLKPGRLEPLTFERSFRRHRRVADALKTLKEIVPADDRIFLVGYSEGAYLAPQVAARDPRVQAVAMIGGGTRGWLKEELSNAKSREKAALVKQIREIQNRSRSHEKWNGFSYATWCSYRNDDTLQALKKLNQPVLSILGAKDRVIDFKSALADLRTLAKRQPVKTEVLRQCGHEFKGHWPEVRRALSEFLDL